jgi:hypothetical protein
MDLDFCEKNDSKTLQNVIIIEGKKEEVKNEVKVSESDKNTNVVICGNTEPLKNNNSWMIKEVIYSEPSDYEKSLLKGTLSASELIEKEKTEEQIKLNEKKAYITKVKVLALYKCKFGIFDNPSNFTYENKKKVMDKMQKIINNYSEDELTSDFNEIVGNVLADSKTLYENLPIMRN